MSTTIDQRIVEMQFDNRQFESNVHTSLSTLDKLKKSLKLDGASKGLEDINNAVKNNNLGMIGSAAETVGLKFNAMYTMADQALRNIVNKVQHTAGQVASAFTIDPIKTGLQEYETQINAVQTIMANTSHAGTTLNDVNHALDTLNTYADKTIYNFTEMTRNIGTFTAAGVDLQTSVDSIQGIANLAAVSGSTSQQASTAMYQLSQALAAGKVSLMDWNSVVNAGMGGKVFQDALIRTSELLDTGAKKAIETHGSFRESLTKGEWLTTEVLTETLKQMAGAYSKADLMAQGFTETQATEIATMAKTATDAATKVKTFTQLMDTLKESVQSGWTQTWELLVGDFEEAKSLWTGVSDSLGGLINDMSESRNTLLADTLNSPWEKLIDTMKEAGVESSEFEAKVREIAKDNDVPMDELVKKYGSFEKACRSGKVSSDILNEALKKLGGSTADLSKITGELKLGSVGDDVKQAQEALKSLGHDLGEAGADGIFGGATESAIKAFQEAQGLEITGIIDESTLTALKEASAASKDLTESCGGLVDKVTELGGREMIIQSFANIFKAISNILRQVKYAFRDVFPKASAENLISLIERFKNFTEAMKPSINTMWKVRDTFRGIFSVIDIGLSVVKAIGGGFISVISSLTGLSGGLLGVTAAIGNWLTGLRDSVKESNIFGKAIDKIVGAITKAIDWIKQFGSTVKESLKVPDGPGGILGFFIGLWNIVKSVGTFIINTVGSIGSTIAEAFGKGDIFEVFNTGLISGIFLSITKFTKSLSDGFDNAGGILENVSGILDDVRGCFQAYQDQLKAGTLMKIASAIGILAASIFVISTIDPAALTQSLTAITILFADLLGFSSAFSKLGGGFKEFTKVIPLLLSLSIAILILAAALKVVSTIKVDALTNSVMAISILMATLVGVAKAMEGDDKVITKFAGQMVIMSVAIAALAGVAKLLGTMNWGELAKGGVGLLGIVTILISAAKIMNDKHAAITKFAGQMVIMSVAIVALSGVAKLLGSMSWEQLAKAGSGILGIVLVLVSAATIMNSKDAAITKFAGQMLIMSIAIGAVAGVGKLLGSMSWGELAKGGVGLLAIVVLLVSAVKIIDSKDAAITKFAGQMLIMSIGITIMAGALKTLAGLSVGQLLTGIIGLAGALAVVGIAGMLLQPVVPVISALGGALALFGLGVVGIGAGLMMIGAGIASIAGSIGVGAVAIVSGLTSIILGLLNLVPEIAQIIGRTILEVAAILGDYAPQLGESLCKLLVSSIESLATYAPQLINSLLDLLINVINGLADHMPKLIQAFSNLLGALFKGVADAFAGTDTGSLLKGVAAVGLMAVVARLLSGMLSVLPSAMVGLVAVGVLIAELALVLAAVGQLAKIPGVEDGITKAGDILNGIGKAIGKFIGGIGEGITESLVGIGQNIADFMDKLSVASTNAQGVDATAFDGVARLIDVMSDIALTTVGTSISDIFTLGGTSMEKFQTDGVAFFNAMRAISQASSGIALDEASIGSVIGVASKLSELQSSLEPIGGVMDWFTGRDDLSTFGTNAGQFISSMTTALSGLGTISFDGDSLTAIIDAATKLSDIQSSLEPIGGVIDWFTGRSDLATFGGNVGQFISSMTTALSSMGEVTFNSETLTAIIDAATKLSGLQSSLEPIGGVVDWFTGRDDLATFGGNVGGFISSMITALSSLGETSFDTEALTSIVDAATKLAGLQESLENIGGVVDWFTGRDDLATFGENIASFIGSMTTAFGSLGEAVIDTEAMTSMIDAATKLAGLQSSLENMGGVVDWFVGASDLGTFGTKIGEFATAMGTLRDKMGESGISQDVITSITNTGEALVALNGTLPEKGWFDKKEDLTDFSTHITSFADAIASFSATASTLNADGINVAMDTANKIKELINSIATIDTSGVAKFTGVGTGGMGADGPMADIATAMSTFSSKVSGIDTAAVSTASSSALRLKTLINGLVDLDTSGVSKFKPESIGTAMKSYMDKVTGMDTSSVSNSITMAGRLKNLIIGLAGIDTSGVSSFISAVTDLCSMDIGDFSVPDLSTLGTDLVTSIISGITTKSADMSTSMTTLVSGGLDVISNNAEKFKTGGTLLMTNLINGIKSKASMVSVPITSAVALAVTGVKVHHNNFKVAGNWLGEGLIIGINAKKQAAYNAGFELGKKAQQGVKDGEGAASPSKEGIRAGHWLGEGLIIGIIDMCRKVYKAGHDMGDTAAKSLSSALSRANELVNYNMETQPTIRPVLDLSDVKAGADSISSLFNNNQSIGLNANLSAIGSMVSNRQNGSNDEVVSAINKLNKSLSNIGNTTYQVNGITYDDGSAISNAVSSLIRATRVEGRI